MQAILTSVQGSWLNLAVILALGAAMVVGLAMAVQGWLRSAFWQRTLWRVAVLGLLAWVLAELMGLGAGLSQLGTVMIRDRVASVNAAAPIDVGGVARPEALAAAATHSAGRSDTAETLLAESTPLASLGNPWTAITGQPVAAIRRSQSMPNQTLAAELEVAPEAGRASAVPALAPGSGDQAPKSDAWPVIFHLLEMAWGIGVVLVLGRIGWNHLLLLTYRRRHPRVECPRVTATARRLAQQLGLKRRLQVVTGPGLPAPVVFGLWRPTIVLPGTFQADFDDREQDAVLAHELSHLAAGDPVWLLLADLLCAVLWWHPVAWCLRRRLRAAAELAADEAALLVPEGPSLLAACLVKLARRLTSPRRLGWISAGGSGLRSSLSRRVERLLAISTRRGFTVRRRTGWTHITLAGALVLMAIGCTAWVHPRVTLAKEGETAMGVLKCSWRKSLAAAVLAAVLQPALSQQVSAAESKDPPRGPEARGEGPRREGAGRHREGQPGPGDADREGRRPAEGRPQISEEQIAKMKEMREKIQQLMQDGKTEEAERLRNEMMERFHAMRGGPRDQGPGGRRGPGDRGDERGGPRPGEGMPGGHQGMMSEGARRVMHLHMAIENLRAAGMEEAVDRLAPELKRLQAELRERGERIPELPRHPFPGERDQGPGGRRGPGEFVQGPEGPRGPGEQGPGQPPRELVEMRTQLERVSREMAELREQLRKLLERGK